MFATRTLTARSGAPALRALRGIAVAALMAACGLFALPASATVAGPVLSATPGDGKVDLNWTSVEDAISYDWRMSSDDGGSWGHWTDATDGAAGITVVGGPRGRTVTDLTNGTPYTFQVRAVVRNRDNTSGAPRFVETDPSNSVTATPASE